MKILRPHLGWFASFAMVFCGSGWRVQGTASDTVIWFHTPGNNFSESCPLGNGRLGAMFFGGATEEHIVLNESSVWSGSKQDADREGASKALPEIRRLLLEGKNVEAEQLVNANFACKGPGSGQGRGAKAPFGCYQVLGNLRLVFSSTTNASITNYRRELDLADAVMRMHYTQERVTFSREAFVSKPDEAIVLRLAADRPGRISSEPRMHRPDQVQTLPEPPHS